MCVCVCVCVHACVRAWVWMCDKIVSVFTNFACVLHCAVLDPILLEDNGAGLLECVRVYGDLSQDAEVRKLIIEKKSE